jgi:ubiquinone/menaquinone biosynthesis C-methylase UbiE
MMKRSSEKKHWDDFWAGSANLDDVYGTDRRIVEDLAKHVDVRGLRVLEVGAGTGRDAGEIAAVGARVVALDYSEESLRLLRSTLPSSAGIVCGDATKLPFAAGSFDVVYHQGLLEHFRRPEDVLDENLRVLKTGGILLVDVPQKYHYYTLLKHLMMAFGKWFAGWRARPRGPGARHVATDMVPGAPARPSRIPAEAPHVPQGAPVDGRCQADRSFRGARGPSCEHGPRHRLRGEEEMME